MNVHKTPEEYFEYTVVPVDDHPLSRQLYRGLPYANALPIVSLMRPARYPDRDNSPAVTKLLIEHRATRPHILSVFLLWKTDNLSVAIFSAASCCPEASWMQRCRRATHTVNSFGICTADIDFSRCVIL